MRGRKVDTGVHVFANGTWDNEICLFEFETCTASDSICLMQHLKSVRVNSAVLHDLEYKGVDTCKYFPIIAEGRGFCLSFYTLKRSGSIIAAGKSTRSVVWIPSDMVQLKQFLKSDSIQILLRFADHILRYAVHVQETLSLIRRLPSTPPPRYNEPLAAFTPHKRNKPKYVEDTEDDLNVVEDHDEEEDSD
ncbi:hypothetical protein EMPS_10828 [Entomortierella parvispora]|uniref:Uncharacterized protein n=1 Tax=Entomortierella parvispora TaxID=205924 RepID=A0A9P3HKI1_9FUNG|nr:hypothetical protein EMPS_10828 [Entomortierella parvispora]